MDRSLLEKYYEKSALKSNNPPTSVKEKTEKIIPPQKTKEFSNQYEEEPAEGELPRLTLGEKILKIISTNPKDRKIQEKLEKIKKAKIEVTKKINYILEHDIPKIKDDIQSTYVKAIKSSSKQEEIFLAKRIKNLDLILNSKWEILGKLQRIQHYYERILAVGDIGVSLKDFGLGEFSETEIEDMTYDVIIGDAERTKKIELTDVVTSIPNNSEAREEDLKDILDEIRLKKEVIKE